MQFPFDEQELLAGLPHRPGVYLYENTDGTIIYVGKARDIKNRVSSYFQKNLPLKTHRLMQQVAAVDITLTETESDALILEATLIKAHSPRYNILLKDDKTYPYIVLTANHDYSRLLLTRKKNIPGVYFGPYPNTRLAKASVQTLQKMFLMRTCEDNDFATRSRPCLQYQIKRCSAPCVKKISHEDYQQQIKAVQLFLEGRSHELIEHFATQMMILSQAQRYEEAADVRDKIQSLKSAQLEQGIHGPAEETDLWTVVCSDESVALSLVIVRGGRCLGARAFEVKQKIEQPLNSILSTFLRQYYLGRSTSDIWPETIIVSHAIEEKDSFLTALLQEKGKKLNLIHRVTGLRQRWLKMAHDNALSHLTSHQLAKSKLSNRYTAFNKNIPLTTWASRLECFDISHTNGQETIASCVVFDEEGPNKSAYRRYHIKGITPGDDYAAMKQALTRRFAKITQRGALPDILLIDGGKGQLAMAHEVLTAFNLTLPILGLAKGPKRESGKETLWWLAAGELTQLSMERLPRLLIEQVRDEAHRFAVAGHQARRQKKQTHSILDDIPGIGPKKKRALLAQFGGLSGLRQASREALLTVPGINKKLALLIYETLK